MRTFKICALFCAILTSACATRGHYDTVNFYNEKTGKIERYTVMSPNHPNANSIASGEAYALARQLQRCWSIEAGALYPDDLIVKVRVVVSRDRQVLSAAIIDQWRYSKDLYFRSAADAAIRAFHSPECKTLELPPNKYEMWKDIVVTFDPSDML